MCQVNLQRTKGTPQHAPGPFGKHKGRGGGGHAGTRPQAHQKWTRVRHLEGIHLFAPSITKLHLGGICPLALSIPKRMHTQEHTSNVFRKCANTRRGQHAARCGRYGSVSGRLGASPRSMIAKRVPRRMRTRFHDTRNLTFHHPTQNCLWGANPPCKPGRGFGEWVKPHPRGRARRRRAPRC